MKIDNLKRVEKIITILLVCLVIFVIGCVFIMISKEKQKDREVVLTKQEMGNIEKENEETELKLTQNLDLFPKNCTLDNKLPEVSFTTENNEQLKLSNLKGKVLVITFWASWCKHCKNELAHAQEFYNMLNNYKDVQFILVDKLDGSKETKEQALKYLKDNNIPFTTVFDEKLSAYKTLGIKVIPTTLIIDKNGVFTNFYSPEIEDSDKLEALIKKALDKK